jgi:DinB superfamily
MFRSQRQSTRHGTHRSTHRPLGFSCAFLAFALLFPGRAARAQFSPDRATAVEVRREFLTDLDTLQSKFMALAEAFPAEKYAWRPAPGVRSVGEVFMHVASEYYMYTPLAYGAAPSPVVERSKAGLEKFENMSDKPRVLKHLREGFAYAKQVVGALDEEKIAGVHKIFGGDHHILETSFSMTDDLHEHLGQLIAYARMNGVKPPWTK